MGLHRLAAAATLVAALLTLAILPGCDGDDPTGALVVGVTSDFVDITQVQIRMAVDGEVLKDDTTPVGGSGITFPTEFSFEDVADGQTLTFTLRGIDSGGNVVVARHMETTAVADRRGFVPLHLGFECRLAPPGSSQPSAPTCNETTETCIGGSCASAVVPSSEQSPYDAGWTGGTDDACKPAGSTPELVVGVGQSDFFTAEDYEVAQVEAGPQGGYHIWVAARLRGLRQSGSITETGAEIPSLGLSITPLKVIFTFDADEGGFCKIFGLRVQLDIDGDPIETMLGEPVKVVMTITDSEDDTVTAEKWLTLSDDTI